MSNENSDEEIESKSQSDSENGRDISNELSNIKGDLNIKDSKKKQKMYFDTSNVAESEKNLVNSSQVQFNDVMKAFTGQVTETEKAQIGKSIKTFAQTKDKDKIEIKFNDTTERVLERTKNYEDLVEDITKYQSKVKANREADVIDFTADKSSIAKRTAKQIASSYKEETDMEKGIKQLLIANHCDIEERMIKEENARMLQLTPEEMEKKYNEIRRTKALLFQKQLKDQRKKKIKSKLFHKINKKRREKEENEVFKQLEEIDPEAVQQYLQKKQKDRARERMELKHSFNSKFNKTVKRYNLYQDQQVKEAIKENYQLRDKLLQKVKGEEEGEDKIEEGDDEDDEGEENEVNDGEEGEVSDDDQDHDMEIDENNLLINFEEKKEKKPLKSEMPKTGDSGLFSMKFMQKANEEGNEAKQRIKKALNDMDLDESLEEDKSNDDSESSQKNKLPKKQSNKQPKLLKESQPKSKAITHDDLAKVSFEASKLLSSANEDKETKVNLTKEDLANILAEDNITKEMNEFNSYLVENNTNKQEYLEGERQTEMNALREKTTPYLSGWGNWTGESKQLQAKEFLQKKRYEDKIKRMQSIQNEDTSKNPYIKVNNSFDKNFSNYLVKELPLNVSNREQFERMNNHSIGREWNSLTTYKKLIQPKIIKKIGQIIEPMKLNDSTTAKKLCDIIEKATKKKQRTKSKL